MSNALNFAPYSREFVGDTASLYGVKHWVWSPKMAAFCDLWTLGILLPWSI